MWLFNGNADNSANNKYKPLQYQFDYVARNDFLKNCFPYLFSCAGLNVESLSDRAKPNRNQAGAYVWLSNVLAFFFVPPDFRMTSFRWFTFAERVYLTNSRIRMGMHFSWVVFHIIIFNHRVTQWLGMKHPWLFVWLINNTFPNGSISNDIILVWDSVTRHLQQTQNHQPKIRPLLISDPWNYRNLQVLSVNLCHCLLIAAIFNVRFRAAIRFVSFYSSLDPSILCVYLYVCGLQMCTSSIS